MKKIKRLHLLQKKENFWFAGKTTNHCKLFDLVDCGPVAEVAGRGAGGSPGANRNPEGRIGDPHVALRGAERFPPPLCMDLMATVSGHGSFIAKDKDFRPHADNQL